MGILENLAEKQTNLQKSIKSDYVRTEKSMT